ncbi:RIP metalloprotease RseP [Falsirhodobacter xinxiangensis]|uniref:RIP metalloprotease RseP n=1 Tax=Falsirhodobacter xinxiangensis TaxID=2530049 RepID=UPI0010AACF46|nr:RIP metalloprotease RseP [Rhodobacter xinxiangensis]
MDLTTLLPGFGGLVWTVAAFVVALSIIVAIHEYGHYIVGRWSGIHAEVFSLGFGPILFSRVDRRGTRWQVAALPLGGYVKFLGDSDAASGRDDNQMRQLTPEDRRHTMHGAPLWARAATVAAGPAFNFVSAILIFAGFALFGGVATDSPLVGSVKPLPQQAEALVPGDLILSLDGKPTPDLAAFYDAAQDLPPAPTASYVVKRGEAERTIAGPYPFPPVADGVAPQSAAIAAGMRAGDVVTAVNGTPVHSFNELRETVGASDGAPVTLEIWRGGETLSLTLTPKRQDVPLPAGGFETRWLIGLTGGLVFQPETRTPGVLEAVGLGASQTWAIGATSLSGLWHMITGAISTCNLQGPIGIAETSGAAASAGAGNFIWFIAVLSTAVGLMNLFPVPVLDGGHLVFHAVEAVTGKPPGDRTLQALMATGFALILTLMMFALTNDIFCP